MAMMLPVGREHAMACVARGELPVQFGSPHPWVAILEQEGKFRIRELVVDEAEAEAASKAALEQGGSWMPEHHYALGKPTGRIHAEAATREELLARMRTMRWPKEW